MTSDLRTRFTAADGIGAPDLWGEARRRAAAPEAPPRTVAWPPGAARRAAVGALAFAVFAVAVAFAWDLASPDRRPAPRPPAAVDLAAELPIGWSELPAPPEDRSNAATAWTGSQLLVWGGYEFIGSGDEDPDRDGFVFDAASRTWTPMPESPLEGRSGAASAWTGEELLVWGGWDGGWREIPYFSNGAAYDPAVRTWRMLPPAPVSERRPFSVWTGEELIVWGNADRFHRLRDGAAYDPAADTWRRIADAPTDITDGSAVWTGDEMIVFGASLDGNNHADTRTAIGIAYDPAGDTWRELPPSELSPQAMTAAWLDREMIAWDYDQASAAYDPVTNVWRRLERVPLEFSECYPKSVATDAIVFGEFCGKTVVFSPDDRAWHREPMPDLRQPDDGCCWVHEPVVAGDVVLVPSHLYTALGLVERRLFVYNPPDLVRTDTTGEVLDPEPFLPATTRNDDRLRMPVVFPDGARATIVFPIPLGLDELGVQPDVSYVWKDDPPPRFPIVFLHDPNASIVTYVEGTHPLGLVSSQGNIEIWEMSEAWQDQRQLSQGHWLRFSLPSWTVLAAIRDSDTANDVAAALQLQEIEGFPVVTATGPLSLAEGSGESEGAQLAVGDAAARPDTVSQLDSTIFLGVSECDGFETEVSPDYGAACLGSGNVFASIYGTRENGFVARAIEGIRVEDFRAA